MENYGGEVKNSISNEVIKALAIFHSTVLQKTIQAMSHLKYVSVVVQGQIKYAKNRNLLTISVAWSSFQDCCDITKIL